MSPNIAARVRDARERRAVRRDEEAVEGEAEHGPLLLQGADDPVGDAAHADLAADGVEPLEEGLHHLGTDHDHREAKVRLLLGEEASLGQVVLLDAEVVGLGGDRLQELGLGVRDEGIRKGDVLDGAARPRWEDAAHDGDVGVVDARAALKLAPLLLGDAAHLHEGTSAEGERVDAEQARREVLLDVPTHPLDDGHDRDEEHHADHHAGEREEALQLLHAQGGKGEPDGFDEGHAAEVGVVQGERRTPTNAGRGAVGSQS